MLVVLVESVAGESEHCDQSGWDPEGPIHVVPVLKGIRRLRNAGIWGRTQKWLGGKRPQRAQKAVREQLGVHIEIVLVVIDGAAALSDWGRRGLLLRLRCFFFQNFLLLRRLQTSLFNFVCEDIDEIRLIRSDRASWADFVCQIDCGRARGVGVVEIDEILLQSSAFHLI